MISYRLGAVSLVFIDELLRYTFIFPFSSYPNRTRPGNDVLPEAENFILGFRFENAVFILNPRKFLSRGRDGFLTTLYQNKLFFENPYHLQ